MSRPRLKPAKFKLTKDNGFKTYISTNEVNEDFPKVVYVRAKVKVTPLIKEKTYEDVILNLKETFNEYGKNILKYCDKIQKNFIFTIDFAERSVAYGKTSHLKYDIYVKPVAKLSLKDNIHYLSEITNRLDNKLIGLFNDNSLKWGI